ncbi:MAG: energy-coupling factor transporter transmembrane protein EcfT [Lachnospiraceae bacterium]|nr:energy-coupling factor transporter transmembrane protein EcfT [Lachnospiraceae bacterium]
MKIHLDPRTKLYFLLLANLLLFFHVDTKTEVMLTILFFIPFFFSERRKTGIGFGVVYVILLAVEYGMVFLGQSVLQNFVSMVLVGIRMIFPCLITGAYAFSTTGIGEFVCALRRMGITEKVIVPCMVVIRFFPTVKEDYRQIKNAMALRGIAVGNFALLRHPAQSLEYILIPLLMNANNVAQDLSVAALTKGIGIKGKHTSMVQIRMKALDLGYMILCSLPFVLFLGGK